MLNSKARDSRVEVGFITGQSYLLHDELAMHVYRTGRAAQSRATPLNVKVYIRARAARRVRD